VDKAPSHTAMLHQRYLCASRSRPVTNQANRRDEGRAAGPPSDQRMRNQSVHRVSESV